ncbi:MAG TPA: hypothetical protein VF263_07820 [Longimicrobiaceae bacterium]
MSTADESFRTAAHAHVLRALDAIAEILGDKTAPAATRLRAAFGLIELVYGPPRRANAAPLEAQAAALMQRVPHGGAQPAKKESVDEHFRRMRQEKNAASGPRR